MSSCVGPGADSIDADIGAAQVDGAERITVPRLDRAACKIYFWSGVGLSITLRLGSDKAV